jgi:hypothetical protein
MTDYNPNDININLQFQINNLNRTLMDTRILVNSLDNDLEKVKLENKRLKDEIDKLTIIKEKYEPSPRGFVQAMSSEPSPRGFEQASDSKIIKNNETHTQSDKSTGSYFNILSYFRK